MCAILVSHTSSMNVFLLLFVFSINGLATIIVSNIKFLLWNVIQTIVLSGHNNYWDQRVLKSHTSIPWPSTNTCSLSTIQDVSITIIYYCCYCALLASYCCVHIYSYDYWVLKSAIVNRIQTTCIGQKVNCIHLSSFRSWHQHSYHHGY